MTTIDRKYKTQNLEKWEMESLFEKNRLEKPTIKTIITTFSFLIILALILPYLPPIKAGHEYSPPENLHDYFEKVLLAAILLFSILFFTFIFNFLRNKIDEKMKLKRVGTFEIKTILYLGKIVFIGMNNLNFLILKSSFVGLKYANVGQIISVKKTASNKVLNIRIRDKEKFETA